MRVVDANIFLRYLTWDDAVKAEACAALLERVRKGLEVVATDEAIITEVVYVLSSPRVYHLSHGDVRDRHAPIIKLRGLRLPGKRALLQALDLYAQHSFLDFEDAVAVAHRRRLGVGDLLSYDMDFDRLMEFRDGSMRRNEPWLLRFVIPPPPAARASCTVITSGPWA